ncbi:MULTISPECIES: hypothetical protein [unclassified Microcoleus]|uniref:hypothetical protein n=1 Tax=unclassified Microcoleus TaxID=2642155 RepID=UPI002FD47D80
MYRDVQIYIVGETRRAGASRGFVNLGVLGSRARPHSVSITFVTNIDLVRIAVVRFLCAESNLGNKSGFGCNTPRYDDFAVWRPEQVLGDRRKAWAARVDPHGRG